MATKTHPMLASQALTDCSRRATSPKGRFAMEARSRIAGSGRLILSVLGGFMLRVNGGDGVTFSRRKSQALFAYLALRPGHLHPRDTLAALLWSESGQREARHSLRQALLSLRSMLPRMKTEIIGGDGDGVALTPGIVDVDVARFKHLVADGSAPALAAAAGLYRGDLLDGLNIEEEPWEEWLRTERHRLHDMHVDVLQKLLAEQTHASANQAALQTAARLLAIDPLQEAVHRTLMTLYVRQGRRAAALAQFQACVSVLRRELGVGPEKETLVLYRDLMSSSRGAE